MDMSRILAPDATAQHVESLLPTQLDSHEWASHGHAVLENDNAAARLSTTILHSGQGRDIHRHHDNSSPDAVFSTTGNPRDKLAIPRRYEPGSLAGQRSKFANRVSRACNRCRRAKTKCSGGDPCKACQLLDKDCTYSTGKIELQKRHMESLVAENEELRATISSLENSAQLSSSDKARIRRALRTSGLAENAGHEHGNGFLPDRHHSDDTPPSNESFSMHSVNGYGNMHSVSSTTSPNREYETFQRPIFLSEQSMQGIDTDSSLDPYAWPEDEHTVEILLRNYFETIHEHFPVLDPDHFESQIATCKIPENRRPRRTSMMDFATLNMVMALSSKHLQLTEQATHAVSTAPELFFQRAQPVEVNDWRFLETPDMVLIVYLALYGLFATENNLLEKAWTVVGFGLRSAISLRYHLEDGSSGGFDSSSHRRRLWLAMCSLESHLSAVRSLPGIVQPDALGMYLLKPLSPVQHQIVAEQSLSPRTNGSPRSSSRDVTNGTASPPNSCFECHSRLSPIVQSISQYLQLPTNQIHSSSFSPTILRQGAGQYEERLKQWAHSLPAEIHTDWRPENRIGRQIGRKDFSLVSLTLAYHSTMMLLCRPFVLMRNDELHAKTKDAMRYTWTSGCYYAESCVKSAEMVVYVLDQLPQASCIFEIPARWNTNRTLCQAGEILLEEYVVARDQGVLKGMSEKTEQARLALRWLDVMKDTSSAALGGYRALSVELDKH